MKTLKKLALTTTMVLAAAVAFVPSKADAAGRKTMYLIKEANGMKFTYTKKGLLKKRSYGGFTTTYSYNDEHCLTKAVMKNSKGKTTNTTKFTYDKKGRIKQISDSYTTSKYTWKNGRVTTCKIYTGKQLISTATYSYKRGYPTKISYKNSDKKKYSVTYTWNSKGNVTKRTYKNGNTAKFTMTYKGEKPVKYVSKTKETSGETYSGTYPISCKSVKVSSSYKKAVKAQQRMLRNCIETSIEGGTHELGYYDIY